MEGGDWFRVSDIKSLFKVIFFFSLSFHLINPFSSEMWSYVWSLLVLFVVCKDIIIIVMAKSTESPAAAILLPSQTGVGSVCSAPDPSLNYKPVIGVLSHPGDGATGRLNNDTNASYIAASYVKLAEAGGARVIPLIYNEPEELLFQVAFR